jgi:hypothetical protein
MQQSYACVFLKVDSLDIYVFPVRFPKSRMIFCISDEALKYTMFCFGIRPCII